MTLFMNPFMPFQRFLRHLLMCVWLLAGLLYAATGQSSRAASSSPRAATTRDVGLDRIARVLPDDRTRAVPQPAASLAAHARTDNDKARLLFAWLAYHVTYDTKAL